MSSCPKAFDETYLVPEPDAGTAVFSGGGITVALREAPASWLRSVRDRLEQLLALPQNWNSYGARPVSQDAVAKASACATYLSHVVGVTEPAVGATPDGDVGFCWDLGGRSLDVSIDGTGLISYVYLDEENHGNDRDTCTRDIAQLIPLLTQWSS